MGTQYIASSGMTPLHFEIFRQVAQQENRIIVVRDTNLKSTHWIGLGYPPKPKELESLHTAEDTGKITARTEQEKDEARRRGFYVIDPDGIARNGQKIALNKKFPFNTPEKNKPGQVIHPQKHLAVVGDYDLMGVIDPSATGRVIALAASDGELVSDRTNPDVERVRTALNSRLDEPRVMHGPQDLYGSFRKGCTAFLPDGTTQALPTQAEVEAFYAGLRRQTIQGKY